MRQVARLRWYFIIGLFVCVFLDGAVSQQMANQLFRHSTSMVPEFTALWLMAAAFFEDDIHMPTYWFAVVAGIIFDIFYMGYWGIYVFIFPVIVWLAKTLRRYLPVNLFATLLVCFLGFALQSLLSWIAFQIIGVTSASLADFLVVALAPTLAFNEIMVLIFYLPLRQLYLRRQSSR
ncbi:rod shape-determining protein MreD [Furfurilactobacillus sp. WILCCON 0119]|uniref:rod shape-determining protein MreD n=1 Tax=Furfurilactobacillus entadae TaxID=2922307 RepID=UPI0035EFFB24